MDHFSFFIENMTISNIIMLYFQSFLFGYYVKINFLSSVCLNIIFLYSIGYIFNKHEMKN